MMLEPVVFFIPLMPKNHNLTSMFGKSKYILLSVELQACCANHAQVTVTRVKTPSTSSDSEKETPEEI